MSQMRLDVNLCGKTNVLVKRVKRGERGKKRKKELNEYKDIKE